MAEIGIDEEIIDMGDEVIVDETEDDVNELEETNVIEEPEEDPTIPDVTEDDGTPEDPTAPETIDYAEQVDTEEVDVVTANSDVEETNDLTEYETTVEEHEVQPLISNQVTAASIGNVQEGERVMLAIVDGDLTVIGTVGSGDRQQNEINQAAQAAASAIASAEVAETAAQTASTQAASAQASATAANEHLKSVVSGATSVEKAVSVMQTALASIVDYDPNTTQETFTGDGSTDTFQLSMEATDVLSVTVNGEPAEFTCTRLGDGRIIAVTLGEVPANQAAVVVNYEHATLKEYFWHDTNGAHVLGDSTGYRNDIKSTGMEVVDVSSEKAVAKFGAEGAQIGKDDGSHVIQTSASFKMADNENQSFFEVIDLKGATGQATIQENVKIMQMASTHPIQYNTGGWNTIRAPHIATTFFVDEIVSLTINGTDISDISEVTFENSHRETLQTSYNQLNVDFDYYDSDSNASRFLNTTELAEGVTIVDDDPTLEITKDNPTFVIMRKETETHPGGWVTLPDTMVSDYVIAPTGSVQVAYTNAVITYKTSDSNMQSLTFGSRNPGAVKGKNSTSLGQYNSVTGDSAFGSGLYVEASGRAAHAEGQYTKAQADYSHAEGISTVANGEYSHAEGTHTTANGNSSHAEGQLTFASGLGSHAEGENCVAGAHRAHAEGSNTVASGQQAHSEGAFTKASGAMSHAGGWYTKALGRAQTVVGMYNEESPAIPATESHRPMNDFGLYAFLVGNGTSDSNRSNAFGVDWQGNTKTTGNADIGGTIEAVGAATTHGSVFTKTDAIDIDGALPSAAQYTRWFQCSDKDDDRVAVFGGARETDGRTRGFFYAYNKKSDGTLVNNHMNFYVDKNGNCTYGISDPDEFCKTLHVGDRVSKDQSTAVSMPTGAWHDICSISLPAGTWIIEATAQFAANATGRRYAAISETSDTGSAAAQRQTGNSANAVNGGTTYIHVGCTKALTATKTIYLVGWQNSGAALNTFGCITAVRIR